MRHIKEFSQLFESQQELTQELTPEQIEWLDEYAIGKWTLNPQTGLVDVKGGFNCYDQGLTDFKGVRFGVAGHFYCSYNKLTSLEGAPQEVGGVFNCSDNLLTSLKGAPRKVGVSFDCSDNQLISLEGAPQEVVANFFCFDNPVTESVLKALYKKMRSGMSWPDAVASHWRYIKSEEDRILLAPSNPNLTPEDVKGYEALARLRKRIL
jgi:hypothetical protein